MAKKKLIRKSAIGKQVVTQLGLNMDKGEDGKGTIRVFQDGIDATADKYREVLNKKNNVVDNFVDLIAAEKNALLTLHSISVQDWKDLFQVGMPRETKGMKTYPFVTSNMKEKLEKYLKTSLIGKEFGHTDIQPSRLSVSELFQALRIWINETERLKSKHGKNKPVDKVETSSSDIIFPTSFYTTLKKLKKAKTEVGVLLVGFQAVNNIGDDILQYTDSNGKALGGNTLPMWDRLGDEINSIISNPSFDIETMVEQDINIMNNTEAKVHGTYQAKNVNRALSTLETGLAQGGHSRAQGQDTGFQQNVQKMMEKIDWSKVNWSKSMDNHLHEQTVKKLMGEKVKPVKVKKKGPTGKVNVKKAISGMKRKKRSNLGTSKGKAIKQALAQGAAMRATKAKRNNSSELKEIAGIKKQIQKRLPAEVRRQMGRPALINRTSRFSNSVELKSLRATKAGLSGEFTYLLSPYETFENTGKIRWRTGYNPKPLIAKSIRNLALQYTEQRIVSLRRS